jgi:monoterpene epsilon-lactone hydrolase
MPSPESLKLRALLKQHVHPLFAGNPSLEELRAFMESLVGQGPLPPDTRVEKTSISETPAEWVSGPNAQEGRVIFYLHGGAYAIGSCNSHRDIAARLAIASGARAFVIEYRLAPEHPFPAGIEDAVAAYRWLLENGTKPGDIVIAGDSAGGGLTLATLLSLRDAGDPLPAGAVLLSPWTDLAITGESHTSRAEFDPMLSKGGMPQFVAYYLGDRDPKTPLASPLYGDLRGLPPLMIHVGEDEVLLDDSRMFADRARAAGVDVSLEVWEGMWHVFPSSASQLPEGAQAIEKIGAFVKQRVS